MNFFKKRSRYNLRACGFILVIFFAFSFNSLSQNKPDKSYQIMAGFLLHFTSFVEWPETNVSFMKLCIVGLDPFVNYIDDMVDARPTNRLGKKIIIDRVSAGDDISQCNIVFIMKKSLTAEFWNSLPENHSILLVSEFNEFLELGGIISFYNESHRIRLEINLTEAKKSKLKISSELLKLAKISQ